MDSNCFLTYRFLIFAWVFFWGACSCVVCVGNIQKGSIICDNIWSFPNALAAGCIIPEFIEGENSEARLSVNWRKCQYVYEMLFSVFPKFDQGSMQSHPFSYTVFDLACGLLSTSWASQYIYEVPRGTREISFRRWLCLKENSDHSMRLMHIHS